MVAPPLLHLKKMLTDAHLMRIIIIKEGDNETERFDKAL